MEYLWNKNKNKKDDVVKINEDINLSKEKYPKKDIKEEFDGYLFQCGNEEKCTMEYIDFRTISEFRIGYDIYKVKFYKTSDIHAINITGIYTKFKIIKKEKIGFNDFYDLVLKSKYPYVSNYNEWDSLKTYEDYINLKIEKICNKNKDMFEYGFSKEFISYLIKKGNDTKNIELIKVLIAEKMPKDRIVEIIITNMSH